MKTKILKLLTLVTGLAMGQAFAAGNLFEILPCNSAGETQAAQTATDTPLVAGKSVYFKLRLARTRTMLETTTTTATNNWNYTYIGTSSQLVDNLVHPLKIGIIVSGELRYATYVTNTKATNNLQDFVFEYVTKPGDFALPIRLALKDGNSYIAAGYDQTSPEYVWLNADKWAIQNKDGLNAGFTILQTSDADYAGVKLERPEGGARKTDYSLINAGFYVQTVGFGKKWEEVDANNDGVWWRKVHEGSTVTESLTPCLEMDSVAEDAVTLYVWSKNEDSVKIFGGETVNMKVDTAGTMKDVQVGTITIAAGQLSANFQIEGVTRDTSTELVLSSFKGYTFNQGANKMVPDFRTVKVKCTEPLPPTLKITADTTEAIAGSARYAYAAQLSVSLSEAYDKDLTVTITPSFSDGAGDDDIGTYMALSRNPSATTKPAATTLTVTIPANSTAPQTAYLYAFRSDARTLDENQIVLTPSVSVDDANKTEAEAWLQAYDTLGLNIVAMQPVITTPSAGAKYGTTCNEEMPVTISVDDTYAAWTDDTTGYEIWFKADDTTNFAKLDGTYINDGGELKKLGAGTKPVLVWGNAGEHESEIYVVSPISKKASDPVKVQVTVGPARTVNLEPTDDLKGVYNEGVDAVGFKIVLSEANNLGYPIYAFLMPSTNVEPAMFDQGPNQFILDPDGGDNQANTQGILINPATGDATTPVNGSFMPLDGAAKPLGLKAYFSVVLCKTPSYDKNEVVTRYSSVSPMNITVYNTEPTLGDVKFNGFSLNRYVDHYFGLMTAGGTPRAIPKGQSQTIRLEASDLGSYDVTQGLKYEWTAESDSGDAASGTGTYTDADPDFDFNFPRAGVWTVNIYLQDKDMGNKFIAPYTFMVKVLDQPQAEVVVAEGYDETTVKQSISVKLPIFDTDSYIAVKVTITPPAGNNPGVFKLNSDYKKGRAATSDTADVKSYPDLTDPNEYYVFFSSAGEQKLLLDTESLDGTIAGETKGFIIETEVLGDGTGLNGVYDKTGETWSDYYLKGSDIAFLANNAPVCTGVTLENSSTNAWDVVAGSVARGWINFMVRDVTADMNVDPAVAAATQYEGLKVTITGCPTGVTRNNTDGTAIATPMQFFIKEPGSFTFIPDFTGVQGLQFVTLMIEDKDGSLQSWTYYYTVTPSKFLDVIASGPAGGNAASALSMAYANAAGRGEGHAFVVKGSADAKPSSSLLWRSSWNCQESATATLVAMGYKVGAVDNGAIVYDYGNVNPDTGAAHTRTEGFGFAINENGGLWSNGENYYTYANTDFDSYLYCWLQHITDADEGGTTTQRVGGAIAPEQSEANPSTVDVGLPTEKTEDGGFLPTVVEAIFAREWRSLDNCGDINQDGIPDRFVARYPDFGVLGEGAAATADVTTNLSAFNDDEDFFPSSTTIGNDIIPSTKDNWAVNGSPFTAFVEIRGVGEGLNAGYLHGDGSNPAPDYTADEWRAYFMWKCDETENGGNAPNSITDYVREANGDPVDPVAYTTINITLNDLSGQNGLTDDEINALVWLNTGTEDAPVYPNLALATADLALANNGNGGWSPERPTDPTLADTDGDGLEDGYEYWFWYGAKVGYSRRNEAGNLIWGGRMMGRRLNLTHLNQFDLINSDEIVAAFDPQVNNIANLQTRDFDNDGLLDIEEYLIGSSPVNCDTDNNGVPDGFEVMWGLNPIATDGAADTNLAENPDGDAYAESIVTFGNNVVLAQFVVEPPANAMGGVAQRYLFLVDLNAFPEPPAGWFADHPGMTQTDYQNSLPYFYGTLLKSGNAGDDDDTEFTINDDGVLTQYRGLRIPGANFGVTRSFPDGLEFTGRTRVNLAQFSDPDIATFGDVRQEGDNASIYLFHHDVYLFYGFDPRTAWTVGCDLHGRIPRWCNTCNGVSGVLGDDIGDPVHTSNYTTRDEYLYADYRRAKGRLNPDVNTDNVLAWLAANCTNPNVAFDTTTFGDLETEFASAQHGADTDGDGVADGWEAYVGGDPISALAGGADGDDDGDGLLTVDEFRGTDVLRAYANCPSIAGTAENPVNWIWLNKFLPSDPNAEDTDGDGVEDGTEGGADDTFTIGTTARGFVFFYGEPTDDGTRLCYRGGGMNPCSSDTDFDGLPDAWELQFAGRVTRGEPTELVDRLREGFSVVEEADDGEEDGAQEPVTIGEWVWKGMDATNREDAFTRTRRLDADPSNPEPRGMNPEDCIDEITGTVRDYDFDGDGLENCQEYLVQAIRLWRYDDAETPFMGRVLQWENFERLGLVAEEMVPPKLSARLPAADILQMNFLSGKMFLQDLAEPVPNLEDPLAEPQPKPIYTLFTANNAYADFVTAQEGFDYKSLGYFAPTEHEWDPMHQYGVAQNVDYGGEGYFYMRPPRAMLAMADGLPVRISASSYVSTDPRTDDPELGIRGSDTDGDGMDDFWEIFHGLNPIFGGEDGDVIATAYNRVISDENNMWVGLQEPIMGEAIRGENEDDTVDIQYDTADETMHDNMREVLKLPLLDPLTRPWRLGQAHTDPDGDGLVNREEGIQGNSIDPSPYHTDPTPLWMTDKSSPLSFVSQYYNLKQGESDDDVVLVNKYWFIWNNNIHSAGNFGSADAYSSAAIADYVFSFEETEGCDTDGDWSADNQELVHSVLPESDPLDSTDPDHRAALYLPGTNACVYSRVEAAIPDVNTYDLFRQFTIECWIKPEESGRPQTILERGFEYRPSNLQNSNRVWRANFRLELDEVGRMQGLFDSSDAVASGSGLLSGQSVLSREALPLEKWTHVALSFDGSELLLYLNGAMHDRAVTGLIPANGVLYLTQDPMQEEYPMPTNFERAPGANTIGARRAKLDFDWNEIAVQSVDENGEPVVDDDGDPEIVISTEPDDLFTQFTDFYKGYISEVRIWDGARSASEIRDNYKRRMSQDDIAANRDEVFELWKYTYEERDRLPSQDLPGTRNSNDGHKNLPPQLISLYNFQQLPAAANPDDVAKLPSGFARVLNNFTLEGDPNDEILVGWWNETPLKNTVYNDYHVVPWVQNMVSRLPLYDGSFVDSTLWGTYYAGYVEAPVSETYLIPNGGNPYKGSVYNFERDRMYWRLNRINTLTGAADADPVEDSSEWPRAKLLAKKSRYEMRSQFAGVDDLLPLGGAFAKLTDEYWDGQGASTAWVETGVDADGDGLPDWWEAMYGGATVELDTLIVKDGISMPAWEAYLRDLAAGMQPSGAVNDKFAASADADGDGLVDWWQNIYTITSGADGDDDGDGLANYVEYLLAEVFKLGHFAPDSAFSVNPNVSDYFFKVGESYVGEIFTDHDFVDDRWEDTYRNQDNQVTRHLYDAMSDGEEVGLGGDGWSNYAEFQAGTDPLKSASLGINDDGGNPYIVKEFPVPMVEARIVYNGTQNLNNNPLVVKAWRDETLESQPDATWTIQSAVTAQPDAGAGGDNGNAYEKYLGMNPGKSVVLYLSPGNVRPSSVEISVKDFNYTLHNIQTGEYFFSEPENAEWFNVIGDTARSDGSGKGDIIEKASSAVVGEIDYQTGAVTLDFPKLGETVAQVGIVGQENNDENWETIYNISSSYVRIEYEAPALPNFTGAATYYLGEADAPNGGDVNSFGHVKEGRNTFISFADLDGNGDYTAGEPFGVAPNVDVGWNHAKLQITLTDTSPVTARFSVGGGNNNAGGDNNEGGDDAGGGNGAATNDRDTLYGTEGGNKPIQEITVGHPSGGKYERVRVVRTLINGAPAYSKENKTQGVVVLDKMMSLENDSYITEADFLRDGQFDIDWATLAEDLYDAGNDSLQVSNVSYRVVLGNGDVSNLTTNNLLGIVFNRWFDSPEVYANEARPQAEALGEVTSASPTFKWTVPGNLNSYSAFQVRVKDADGATIWNSGFQLTPASTLLANGLAQYVWQAPLFAGAKTPDGQYVFANGKKYTYQVSLANARYKNSTNWSDEVAFAMNVLTNTTDTGTMKVAVRYFGPTAVANSGVVRVQAFTTPDFSGLPVGEGFVTDVATLSSTAAVTDANATIIGLPEGNYYLRAFVDTETNGLRAAWESWGYACERDMRDCAIFTPKMIKVGPKSGRQDVITVVIEDCDTDKDSLPDAWEWTQKQNLSDLDVLEADFLADSSLVKKSLAEKLSTSAGGTLSSGLSVQLASLHNPYKAAMVLGVDVSNVTDAESAQAAVVSAASTETVEPKTVAITALDFDTATGQVKIQVEATTESAAASGITANPIYTVETSATVKVVVQKKTQLTDATWETIATETLTITGEGPIELTPQAISADTTSGFFRVILEK